MPVMVRPATWKFGLPRIPSACFRDMLLAWFARICASGICSISPAPNVGVGMRKITLLFASCVAKSGCASVQGPGGETFAPVRPVMVKIACTPPSAVPSGFFTNRASRTGPFSRMKEGTLSVPPFFVANATWGFTNGLVPPSAGWM